MGGSHHGQQQPAPLAVKGFNDVRPGAAQAHLDAGLWTHINAIAAEVLGSYGFAQVWLPTVEETALFTRGIGDDTDVVSKEMYSFSDRGGRQLTLRPEGTAGAARAYIQHQLARTDAIQRWWYQGPMFRAERPQKGRYRQFYQIGAELFGVANPAADVEMLQMLSTFARALGLKAFDLRLNTLGDNDSRVAYRAALSAYLNLHRDALCQSCQWRMDKNPLRVLDCKEAGCQDVVGQAPDILASLSSLSRLWFDRYIQLLDKSGVTYKRDSRLVRGLDYYSDAIFEMTTAGLGSQDAILGGGRYDSLITTLGGPPTPAVGFAAGMERLALVVAEQLIRTPSVDLFIALHAPELMGAALSLAQALRERGLRVDLDVNASKLKHALRRADRTQARFVLVLGDNELKESKVVLKRLQDGKQCTVSLQVEAIVEAVRSVEL